MKKVLVFVLVMSFLSQIAIFAEAKTTIEWLQWFSGEAGEDGFYELIKEFEDKNPDITVKLVTLPFGKMRETIVTNLTVGVTADVLGLNMPWTDEFVEMGALEPLEEYIAASTDLKAENLVAAPMEEYKGHSWMVPLTAHPFLMFYNKDLLSKAGYTEAPATWDELKDAASKITDKANNVYGYTMAFSTQPPSNGPIIDMYPLLYTNEGRTVKDSRSNLDSPEVIETMAFLKELNDAGVCAPGTLSKTDPMKLEEFAAGRIGLMITTMPQIATLRQRNAELNFSVAPVPKNKVWAYRVHGWELGISSKSQHKDEAWKFISFLLRPDVNVRFAEMVKQLPGNTAGNADFIDNDPEIKIAQNILREHQSVEELRKTPKAVPSWQILTEEIQKMLKGDQEPAATAKNAHERWNKFFAE